MTTIRLLESEDVPAYVELRREMLTDSPWAFSSSVEDGTTTEAVFAGRLGEPFHVIVGAFDGNGGLVGAAGLRREASLKRRHMAGIWGMYVSPRARKGGVGRRILTTAIDLARTWEGVRSVGLSVSENAKEAKALYESLGFVAWGVEPDALRTGGRSYDETHMVLVL